MDQFGSYTFFIYRRLKKIFSWISTSCEVLKNSCRQKWHLLDVKSCQELLNSYEFECLVTKL